MSPEMQPPPPPPKAGSIPRTLIGAFLVLIGLLLAMIDLPDWGTPLRSIAGSVKHIAGFPPGDDVNETAGDGPTQGVAADTPDTIKTGAAKSAVQGHA